MTPNTLEVVMPAGQTRTRTLTLSNTGSLDMNWEIHESGGGQVTTTSSAGLTRNPSYDPNSKTTQGMFTTDGPGGWSITAPGNVIRSWSTSTVPWAWGVGTTDKVWLSNVSCSGSNCANYEFDVLGNATGRTWTTPWAVFGRPIWRRRARNRVSGQRRR